MSRYLVSEIRCLGCDALVSEQAGPVHAYMLAAPGCWALYGSLQQWKGALTGDDGLTTAQRAVDCYAAQHATNPDRRNRQSVAVHLMSLCASIEHGVRGHGSGRASATGPIVTIRCWRRGLPRIR